MHKWRNEDDLSAEAGPVECIVIKNKNKKDLSAGMSRNEDRGR